MLRSMAGVYRNDIIELQEPPEGVQEETPGIVKVFEQGG